MANPSYNETAMAAEGQRQYAEYAAKHPPSPAEPMNVVGAAAVVLGFLSWTLSAYFFLGIGLAILGALLGRAGLARAEKIGRGRWRSMAGIVMSVLGVLGAFEVLIF